MTDISISILSADFAHLEKDCRRVLGDQTNLIHFDVMDGIFVPNISVGLPVLESLKKSMPQYVYDVHLMLVEPEKYIERFAKAGADFITFHIESNVNIAKAIEIIHNTGCKAGITLRPGTPVEQLYPYLKAVDMVLIMSVEPGYGGQAFLEEAPGRIRALRREAGRQQTDLLIEVDGGIDAGTGPKCIEAGADILVMGSSAFSAENPRELIRTLQNY